MLFRLADGWRAVDGNLDLQQSPALTLEQAQQRVAGMHLIGGTALASLTPLPVPEAPRFDRGWLPPADVIADHLPMYELRVRAAPGGLHVRETGLPFLALAAPIWLMESTARAADAHRRVEMEQKWQEQKARAASPTQNPAPPVPSSSSSPGDF